MSPEHRTRTPFGPLLRGKRKKISGLASVALLMAIGLVTPAAASTHTVTSHGGVTSADDSKCDLYGMGSLGKCKKPRPPKPPTPPTGCFDIDSAVQDPDKYISVVCDGQVYVLTVREAPPTDPTPVGDWQAVGGPTNVVDATLATRANEVYVSVLTSTGAVLQGVCPATEPIGPCTFHTMPTPP
ncbi:hypothetical protein [Streptomyces sp. NRRL B-24720]|uniref:hypothetical protein n=1 Tax=Streptomyces sp. NRRL B-24720 TaxID=1476876 RepID=UPI00131C1B5C|nr:hypothetical protein [Streptomyces sp. NRRL B-24720]